MNARLTQTAPLAYANDRCKCGAAAVVLGMGGRRCQSCWARSCASMAKRLESAR